MDKKNIKRIAAREGLIFLVTWTAAFLLLLKAQKIFPAQLSNASEQKAFILGSILTFIAIGLLLIYSARIFIRLIIRAIKTLKEK